MAAQNKRKAQLLTVSVHLGLKKNDISSSRSTSLPSYEVERIIQTAYSLLKKMANVNNDNWTTPLSFLGLSAGKFTEIKTTSSISQFFKSSAVSSEKDDNSAVLLKQMGWQEIKQKPENETEDGSSFFQKFLSNNQNLERINTSLNLIPKLPQETYQDNDDSQSSMGGMSYNHNNCEGLLNEASSDAKGQNEKLNPNNVECSLICQESVSKTSTKTSIKDFFSKTESEKFNCPGNNSKPSKENGGPISKYFKNPSSVWIDPSEIFPDLNSVDEELISSLPTMFRKQILKMKELQGNSSVQEKTPVVAIQNNNIDCQSCDNEAQKGNESQPTVLKENLNINSDNNENSSVQSEDGKKCSQCNVVFPIFLFDEHMDFHLAETLHRELNYSSQIERPMIVDKKIPQATLPKRKGKASERKLLNEKKKT